MTRLEALEALEVAAKALLGSAYTSDHRGMALVSHARLGELRVAIIQAGNIKAADVEAAKP